MQVGQDQYMAPIDFVVSRSKVTVASSPVQTTIPSLIISCLRPHNGGDERFFKKAISSYYFIPTVKYKS